MKAALAQPTQIVILGGTGDLSQRKLIPALVDLYARQGLPIKFNVIGFARTQRSTAEYRDIVKKSIAKHHTEQSHSNEVVENFCAQVNYVAGSFTKLKEALDAYDSKIGCGGSHRLFYLAVPPKYYEQIFINLHESGSSENTDPFWTHILVEKPFGHNLTTAQALDKKLAELYKESQIFRIDHYLAKEAVQNILSFRFANTLLKSSWDKNSIKSVEIIMKETVEVGDRSGFYEDIGALRDVGQNHLLQLLALVAMREPANFDAESIRLGRAEVLRAIRPVDISNLESQVLRAQYESYKDSSGVHSESETETYFELKCFVDLPEWQDIPFVIRAGKALDQAEVSIVVNFHDVASGLFKTESCKSVENQIRLSIQPEQVMSITLNAKEPGLGYQLESRTLSFTCKKGDEEIKNSYEKVLYASIAGDQTLFTRTEEVIAAWEFINPILEHWHTLPLYTYKRGSSGPDKHIII